MALRDEIDSGQRIGRYLLKNRIGKGGMADIYRADEELPDGTSRTVAIKRLFPKLSADREFVRMFVNEARIAAGMEHPNIVRTYNLINVGSHYYIVMEFLDGRDLDELIHQKSVETEPFSVVEAAYVAAETALGLDYAHKGGARGTGLVVHRDISPGNILVGRDGQVKITDFGIARAKEVGSFTQPGILKGKYDYMAPEYVKGLEFDGRVDLFSLGVVLYEMLTGANPFAAILPNDVWDRIINEDPVLPGVLVKGIPTTMDQVVSRALAKEPNQRFASGKEMVQALDPFLNHIDRNEMAGFLGRRVKALSEKSQSDGVREDLLRDVFHSEPEAGVNRTVEIHVDEILDLVEPEAAPKPLVNVPTLDDEKPKQVFLLLGTWWQKRWPLIIASAALLVVVLAIVFIWPKAKGILQVSSEFDSEVYADGERVGVTPLRIFLPVGLHRIEVRRMGLEQSKSYETQIQKDKETLLRIAWEDPGGNSAKKTRWPQRTWMPAKPPAKNDPPAKKKPEIKKVIPPKSPPKKPPAPTPPPKKPIRSGK